jgi:hypothetical protein
LKNSASEECDVIGRVVAKNIPTCPGLDSLFRIRHNRDQPGEPWWVFYEPPSGTLIPADEQHAELVALVNFLKEQQNNQPGGRFSINEYGQVVARMQAPAGYGGQSVHIVGIEAGEVRTYRTPLTFSGGLLDPRATIGEGEAWPGPLCGITYRFAAPGNPKQPSHNFDEVWIEIGGQICLLSVNASVAPYPPLAGQLAEFLRALRRQLPNGGRFRVNEWGQAFTSDDALFIATVPLGQWFKPLTARS